MENVKDKILGIRILGFPLVGFLVLFVGIMAVAMTGNMLGNMVGALAFALVWGNAVGWIGDRIPIWNEWLGGGMFLACLATGALATFHVLPDTVVESLNNFNNTIGFLDLYILVLITGAILSIDRKLLIKAFAGFIPAIFGSIIVSFLLTVLAAWLVGEDPLLGLVNVALPIMGGGNGAGCIPMSQMWAEMTGGSAESWYAPAFAVMSLGNMVSVVSAALLDRLGKKYPSLTGNGTMMKSKTITGADDIKDTKVTIADYASGFALALCLFVFADFYANNLSIINNMNLGFSIHKFAFMVIFAAILNALGLIPENIRAGARGMQTFFTKYMSLPLMVTVGIGTDLTEYATAFTFGNMVMIVACVVGAIIGAIAVGVLFGFYPVEIGITAGLDMAGGGGAGDVQILGASHRMELMSFAQISSRIGGAIMLIIASAMFGMLT